MNLHKFHSVLFQPILLKLLFVKNDTFLSPEHPGSVRERPQGDDFGTIFGVFGRAQGSQWWSDYILKSLKLEPTGTLNGEAPGVIPSTT